MKRLGRHRVMNRRAIWEATIIVFCIDSCDESGQSKIEVLPMLKFILENGNCTVYQWQTGKKPKSVEEVSLSFLEEEEEQKEDEVCF